MLTRIGELPRVARSLCAEAEFLLELAGDLHHQSLVDSIGEFEMEAGVRGLDRFSETENHRLGVCGNRVKTGGDSDEHDHGKDTEPDE